ncbi:unnamed protein product [Somion occarium]|uniref:Nucleolar protein 58 n=1 Tax=Somion occarium TaxID=3059160 RepID=A0ABP1D4N2_9APHY
MLVLYETSLGYCLFKIADSAKAESEDVWEDFETPEKANKLLKLKSIHRFTSTATAVEEITAIQESKLGKGLKQFLSDEVVGKGKGKESLAVIDPKLGHSISKKLGIKIVPHASSDLFRGIRSQLAALLDGLDPQDLATMSLGLSHSLSRFKLKFSPDKVDTMVVQAIALLDDLDKEINIYAMRVKEWYGWHFPELAKIIVDNVAYAKVIKAMGFRTNAATTDFSSVLPEDLEATVKAAAEISMGTEISDSDIAHINALCDQVVSISAYRTQLAEYLRNRMNAIAPNLTALVGELVGARLISHAGSLLSLAKHPASTVQILGAEKALFRALKTYNTAADDVDLVPTQREPAERALQAVLDAKAEKKKAKEERRAKRKAEKGVQSDDEKAVVKEIDGDKKEKKRKRRESEVNGDPAPKDNGETEEERKARKKARKAEKAAAVEADGESSKKKKRKSEA